MTSTHMPPLDECSMYPYYESTSSRGGRSHASHSVRHVAVRRDIIMVGGDVGSVPCLHDNLNSPSGSSAAVPAFGAAQQLGNPGVVDFCYREHQAISSLESLCAGTRQIIHFSNRSPTTRAPFRSWLYPSSLTQNPRAYSCFLPFPEP